MSAPEEQNAVKMVNIGESEPFPLLTLVDLAFLLPAPVQIHKLS